MPLQVDCETPRGKLVSIPIRPGLGGWAEISFMRGAKLRVVEHAHHRFEVIFFKGQFEVYPGPDRGTRFEMEEGPVFDGTDRRGVVWNFHDFVPVDVQCIPPCAKGMRRRFVRARIWPSETSRESDPR